MILEQVNMDWIDGMILLAIDPGARVSCSGEMLS